MGNKLLENLQKRFSPLIELDYKNPLELLIAVILASQSTDRKVNQITKRLFEVCKTCEDYMNIPLEELENLIREVNYYKTKARRIKLACLKIVEEFGGKVPDSMENLLKLPGIGRKSANVILYNAFGKNEGIAVDTHVSRVSQRLGLTKHKDPKKIELDLMEIFDQKDWGKASNLLVLLGRYICTARKPKHNECPLFENCPSRCLA